MKLRLFIVIFLISHFSFSQPWMKKFENIDKQPNFFEIQEAFEEYAEGKEKVAKEGREITDFESLEREIPGYEQYKRWEYFYESRVDENGEFPNPMAMWNAFHAMNQNKNSQTDTSNHGNWQLIGPTFGIPNDGGMGRINVIEFDPQNPEIMWVGAPAGGLWKSINGGNTWLPTTTDKLPVIGISDIAIHPTNSNIMYLATGDAAAALYFTSSVGVLKSVDGGVTWNTTGLNFNVNQTRKIYRLVINPEHPDTLIAATTGGMYVSADAGATWVVSKSGSFKDVELKPNDANIVYISTNTSIFKSVDAGFTFANQSLSSTFSTATAGIGRIELCVTKSNPSVVYAMCSNATDDGFLQLYKTSNDGATWQQKATSPNLIGYWVNGGDPGGNAWYNFTLEVSPTNENIIFVGGTNVWKSTNGGLTFVNSAHWYGDQGKPYVHADIHDIIFKPQPVGSTSSAEVFIGCDGGVFKTTNGGQTYTDISAGLQIMQLYRMSASSYTESLLIAGSQDNGTNRFDNGVVDRVQGGDGMDCHIAANSDLSMFASFPNGDLVKSTTQGGNFYDITPNGQSGLGKWVTPTAISQSNPDIFYAGYKELFKSNDAGESWMQVTTLLSNNATYQYIAIAPSDENTVYACTNSRIYKTSDGGNTWGNVMTGIPSGQTLTYIAVSEENPDVAYVTLSNYTGNNKVFKTINGGASWVNISQTGLPAIPINCIAFQKNNHERVYVGTDFGVYYTDTTLTTWKDFNNGLPNTYVLDLDIFYPTLKLRAATFGRGIWESNLIVDNLESIAENNFDKMIELFPNPALNKVSINLNYKSNISTLVSIYGLDGKLITEIRTNPLESFKTIDLTNFSQGTYIVKVTHGNNVSRKKLVIIPN